MTPQEAEIIKDVFTRLKATATGPVDPEAAGLVDARLAADRGAGLALVQALVVTDRARAGLAQENEALKQQLAQLQAQGQAPAPQSGGLFGGGAGPWDRQPQPPVAQPGPWDRQAPAQQGGPWGQQPSSGSGFWGSALRTGAGVAGGLFAFEALKGLFGGHGGYGSSAGLFGGGPTIVNETVNVWENDRGGPFGDGGFGGDDGSTRSAGLFDAPDGGDWSDGGGFGGDDDGIA